MLWTNLWLQIRQALSLLIFCKSLFWRAFPWAYMPPFIFLKNGLLLMFFLANGWEVFFKPLLYVCFPLFKWDRVFYIFMFYKYKKCEFFWLQQGKDVFNYILWLLYSKFPSPFSNFIDSLCSFLIKLKLVCHSVLSEIFLFF